MCDSDRVEERVSGSVCVCVCVCVSVCVIKGGGVSERNMYMCLLRVSE